MWDRVFAAQPDPPPWLVLVAAAAALLVVLTHTTWRLARHAITIAHEGGHALIAILTGRRLRGIKVHSDTSGLTVSAGRPTGFGMVLSLFAGYVTPSLLGLAGAVLLAKGRITLLLWVAVLLLFAMLVMTRNAYGVLSMLATTGVVFAVSWFAPPEAQAVFAYAGVWFLLLGGVKPVGELQRLRRRGQLPDSDADQLARLTRVPAFLWVLVFGLITLGAAVAGGALLIEPLVTN